MIALRKQLYLEGPKNLVPEEWKWCKVLVWLLLLGHHSTKMDNFVLVSANCWYWSIIIVQISSLVLYSLNLYNVIPS